MHSRASIPHSSTGPAFLAAPGFLQLLACAIASLTYVLTLTHGFVYDDHDTIVNNAALRGTGAGRAIGSGQVAIFRPVTGLWSQLNYALFGVNPSGWHLGMLALHVVVTYLVFVLARKLFQDRLAAFAVSIVFAVHPTHVENVSWVSAVNDLLMTAFLISSFIVFLDSKENRRSPRLLFAAALFAPALLTKETACVFPVVIAAYAWIFSEVQGWLKRTLDALCGSFAFFAVLALYLGYRSRAVSSFSPKAITGGVITCKTMVLTWPSVLWFEVKHLVFPARLSEFYSCEYVSSARTVSFILPTLLLIATAVVTWLIIRRLKSKALAAFFCAWILLPLVPTLYLRALTPGDFLHDRFLYLPSVGFAMLLVLIVRELPLGFGAECDFKVRAWVIVAITAAGVTASVVNLAPWANDQALYENGVRFAPKNNNVWDNLASVYVLQGRSDEGITIYREILARDPALWRTHYNLAHEYLKRGMNAEAEQTLLEGIALDSTDPQQYLLLSLAQRRLGKLSQARQSAEHAIEKAPKRAGYHLMLGKILVDSGDRLQAAAEFRSELAINPKSAEAERELQRLASE